MTDPNTSGCPHRSILEKLGTSDWETQDQQSLELHIEECQRCQEILQGFASSNRLHLTDTIDAATQLPEKAPELPGFRVERELGRGGGAVVYLAEDLSTSRLVAVKLIPGGWIRGASSRSRWLEEVRVAARMQHHNIVRLYRVEETLHWFLLVFEYIAGGTLRDWMQRPIAPTELAVLMQTIAYAVEQVHDRGVLHLDLKPSNILLDDSQGTAWSQIVPKVSDFGIARWSQNSDDDTSAGLHRCGTPAYMAPEQVLGDPGRFSPATDVYGLGGILYAMLTGRSPFEGSTASGILRNVLTTRVQRPHDRFPDAPRGLAEICLRCLEKNPKNRFATPRQLADALQQWMDLQSQRPEQRPEQRPAHRTRPKFRWLTTGITAALAGIILVFIVVKPIRDEQPEPIVGNQRSSSTTPAIGNVGKLDGRNQDKAQLSLTEWISEVSEEPAAFDAARAARLIAASRRYSDDTLQDKSNPVDQWLRFGVLQRQAAERFSQSTRVELYPAAKSLSQNSVQLLERSVEMRPADQSVLLELVATRYLQSHMRIQLDQNSAEETSQHVLECAACLLPATADALHIQDQKHKVYWLGKILDQYRSIGSMTQWQGDRQTALQLKSWELQSWSMMESEQSLPDLSFRHALMRTIGETEVEPTFPQSEWVIPENRKWLENESVYHRLAEALFESATRRSENAEASESVSKWSDVIDRALEFMNQQKVDPSTLPVIIHNDLIRPLASVSTMHRIHDRVDQAEALQRSYMKLCEACKAYFPNNPDLHLAASEAYLQSWKNEIRRDHEDNAIKALQDSLREARIALDLSPDSARARFQVADRIKRLTRIQSSG